MATRLPRKARTLPANPEAIFGFAQDNWLAADLARELEAEYRTIAVHTFPDGESKVTVPGGIRHAAICCSLDHPNGKLVNIFLAASALRDQGAQVVTLVAPYLPYMRQDKAFHPGEAVSQRVVGNLLGSVFDRFIAVDPHLHRVKSLKRVFVGKPARALSAARLMAEHFGERRSDRASLAIGPDVESTPLVKAFAQVGGIKWITAHKQRDGDRSVDIELPPNMTLRGQRIVIVDDIISSGTTIMTLAHQLKALGVQRIEVYATHALFEDNTGRALKRAGIDRIVSCDGVPHATNAISLAPLLAEGLKKWR